MAEKHTTRRQGSTIAAVDPVSGRACGVMISQQRMQAAASRGMGQAKECAYTVPQILQGPTAIFEGLRREADEDRWGEGWRCYCGLPRLAYHPDGTERPPYDGEVFLVFVNSDATAYNWRWEKADPDNPRLPVNHGERFTRRIL